MSLPDGIPDFAQLEKPLLVDVLFTDPEQGHQECSGKPLRHCSMSTSADQLQMLLAFHVVL